jgi:two-component system, NarL family, response regulator LiaR
MLGMGPHAHTTMTETTLTGHGTEAGPADLRVILADDDPLARRVIRDTLQAAGITVVAEAANGREAVELGLFYRPDVVVMDYMMPEVDGLEATRRLQAAAPEVRIVMLTGSADEELGLRGLAAGATGYLTKDVELDALPRALRGTLAGEAAISRRLALKLVEHYKRERAGREGLRPIRSPLTDREWEVADLLCAGAGTEDIARALVLSTETVRSHLKRIFRKLGVRSRAEAVRAVEDLRGGARLAA